MLEPACWTYRNRRFQVRFCNAGITLSVALLIMVGAELITSNAQREVGVSSGTVKSAYIDKAGKVKIDASRYGNAGGFSDGLAAVEVPRQGWGFIDKTGALVIPPKFESTLGFKEGLAPVLVDGKWGFINKNGTLVIENQFDWAAQFSEGMAIVERSSKPKRSRSHPPTGSPMTFTVESWNLADDLSESDQRANSEFLVIDTTGQILANLNQKKLSPDIDDARFSEGLLAVFSEEKKAMGYINTSWEFVIQPQFENAAPFSEGLARVAVIKDEMEKLAFINKQGKFVIPPTFNTDYDFLRNSSNFSEGLAALSEGLNPSRTKEETVVYIDKMGQIVLTTEFFYAGEFHDGLATVYDAATNKSGFIDKTGKVVIPVQYQGANDFSDGLALVSR
jgi:WG repeat protein